MGSRTHTVAEGDAHAVSFTPQTALESGMGVLGSAADTFPHMQLGITSHPQSGSGSQIRDAAATAGSAATARWSVPWRRAAAAARTIGSAAAARWWQRRGARPSRLCPLRTGIRGRPATGQIGPFAQTHQKSAGARCVLDAEPLRAANACKPVRRVYKRRKQISDLKNESLSIHWG